MRPVMLWGYYGSNYGDNISMDVLVKHLSKKHDMTLASRFIPMADVAEQYGVKYAELFRRERDWKVRLRFYRRWKEHIHIWGGGTSFTNNEGCGNADPFLWLSLIGAKYAYVGIGVDELHSAKRRFISGVMLRRCKFAIFRENASQRLATKYSISNKNNFTVGEDIVYGYLADWKCSDHNSQERYLLLCPRELTHIFGVERAGDIVHAMVSASLDICRDMGLKTVKVLSTDVIEDLNVSETIQRELCAHGINTLHELTIDVNRVTDLIANAECTISARLHVSMVSEFVGKKTVSLSYSDKIIRLYQSLPDRECIDLFAQDGHLEQEIKRIAYSPNPDRSSDMNELLQEKAKHVRIMLDELSSKLMEE